MQDTKHKFRCGFTLTELIVVIMISSVIVLAVGSLLVAGNRAWLNTYEYANKDIRQDALVVTIGFGSIGRKSNRLNYALYEINGDTFKPALPKTADPQEVVYGDAVEFRFWDVPLDETDSQGLMDVTKEATAYALFYLDGSTLKVDYGPYPPGAVPDGGGAKNNPVSSTVLAENVSAGDENGAFSHTTLNGMGQGSVRINIILTDPEDGEVIRVMTATLMRNIWPR